MRSVRLLATAVILAGGLILGLENEAEAGMSCGVCLTGSCPTEAEADVLCQGVCNTRSAGYCEDAGPCNPGPPYGTYRLVCAEPE